MSNTKKLKVTLVKSPVGSIPKHIATVQGLGLRRIRHSVVLENTACIRGMIKKIEHLISVEEV